MSEDTSPPKSSQPKQWYVLRDFRKRNAKSPAYKTLPGLGVQCFTPMHWVVFTSGGRKIREYVPVIQSLLFAFDTRETLEPIVERDRALQFQFRRGGGQGYLMTVPADEMQRFIKAVGNDPTPIYYMPGELTPDKIGKEVIVIGGPLDGYRGVLLKMQGSKKRRLIVEIKGLMAAAVEVNPEYVRFP